MIPIKSPNEILLSYTNPTWLYPSLIPRCHVKAVKSGWAIRQDVYVSLIAFFYCTLHKHFNCEICPYPSSRIHFCVCRHKIELYRKNKYKLKYTSVYKKIHLHK